MEFRINRQEKMGLIGRCLCKLQMLQSELKRLMAGATARESSGMMVAQVICVLLAVGTSVILARNLTPNDMGRYQLVLSIFTLSAVAGLPGMQVVIKKGAMKGYDNIAIPALYRSVVASLIVCTSLICTGWWFLHFDVNREMGLTLTTVGVLLPVEALNKYDSLIQGKKCFRLSRRLSILTAFLSLFGLGVTAWWTGDLFSVILAFGIVKVLSVTIGWILARKVYRASINNASFSGELLKQGWMQSGVQVVNVIAGQLDRIILGVIDPKLLAIYYVGCLIPRVLKDNAKALLTVPIVNWGVLDKTENLRMIEKHGLKVFSLGLVLTAMVWIVAPWLIPIVYGNSYVDAVPVAMILAITIGPRFVALIIWMQDMYQNSGRSYSKQLIVIKVIYILLISVLVPKFYVYGAVAAFAVTDVLTVLTSLYFLRNELRAL